MVEEGDQLHSRAFVALLLLVGAGALAWGLYGFLSTDSPVSLPDLFDISLGTTLIFVTLVFVAPELTGVDPGRPPNAPHGGDKESLSLETLKEYFDLLNQIEEKWAHHVEAVASSPALSRSGTKPASTKPTVTNMLEAEVLAFHTAAATGVPRIANEDALLYVSRAQSSGLSKNTLGDNAIVVGAMEDLLEASRTLSGKDLEKLGLSVSRKVEEMGESLHVMRVNGESLFDYAIRARSAALDQERAIRFKRVAPLSVASIPPYAASTPAAQPALVQPLAKSAADPRPKAVRVAGLSAKVSSEREDAEHSLTWTITLFRGFLKDYFSPREIEGIAAEAIGNQQANPGGKEGELLTYSRLLRNAIIANQKRVGRDAETSRILGEFDQFVLTLMETGFK